MARTSEVHFDNFSCQGGAKMSEATRSARSASAASLVRDFGVAAPDNAGPKFRVTVQQVFASRWSICFVGGVLCVRSFGWDDWAVFFV